MSALRCHFKPLLEPFLPRIWSVNFDTCLLDHRKKLNTKMYSTLNLRIFKETFLPVWVSNLSFSKCTVSTDVGGKGSTVIQVRVSLVLLCLFNLSADGASASTIFSWLHLCVCSLSFLWPFWFRSRFSKVGGLELDFSGAWDFTGTLSLMHASELWPAEFKHMHLQNEHWENHNAWIE